MGHLKGNTAASSGLPKDGHPACVVLLFYFAFYFYSFFGDKDGHPAFLFNFNFKFDFNFNFKMVTLPASPPNWPMFSATQ